MRTTVRIDPDKDARLRELTEERGISFREALTTLYVEGSLSTFIQSLSLAAKDLGLRPGVDLVKSLELSAELEDQAIAFKLGLRK